MPFLPVRSCMAAMLLMSSASLAVSAHAETIEELNALSDASLDESMGIATAHEQAARGELLDALATLERVMAVHPKSPGARLAHAMYLCAIDDPQGGLVELSKLKKKHYEKKVLKNAIARCERQAGN